MMIECPFCGEAFEPEQLVYEFNWGDVSSYYYNHKKISKAPKADLAGRPFYVTMTYDWHGRPEMGRCSAFVNPEKRNGIDDALYSNENGWNEVVRQLTGKKVFEVFCLPGDDGLPVSAKILPMAKDKRKHNADADGMSTGIYCPICEQQLKPQVLKADKEIRIVLSGRPGSGKTVYVTQMISELMQGRLAQDFTIDAANESVFTHYQNNKNSLKVSGRKFILANNPNVVQDPYIFLMKNKNTTIRLVIQDIAGEDSLNHTKYSRAVKKADMILYFVDPWHIEEMRYVHMQNHDKSNAIVERSTNGNYNDLNGVFQQMLSDVNRDFTDERQQLAGILLIKGDYLTPPMLSEGDMPECEMMRQPIIFNDPDEMEFSIAMRSSFIRQCLHEWDSTRGFVRDAESKYAAYNTRYFVTTALGQSTSLRRNEGDENVAVNGGEPDNAFTPDNQFRVGNRNDNNSENWDYVEQVLERPANPQHVIDPIFWCFKRKGIQF